MKNLEIIKGLNGSEFKIYETDSGKWALVDAKYVLVLDTKAEILEFLIEYARLTKLRSSWG